MGLIPYMGYRGICDPIGYRFWPICFEIEHDSHSGLALIILFARKYFIPHRHGQVSSPSLTLAQLGANSVHVQSFSRAIY